MGADSGAQRPESTLNALYDFRPLISPEGWLPPVIDEAQDVAHITPDQIRTSSRVWTIIRPERFVSNPPGWRDHFSGAFNNSHLGTEGSVVPEDSGNESVGNRITAGMAGRKTKRRPDA